MTNNSILGFRNYVVGTREDGSTNSNLPIGFIEYSDDRNQIILYDSNFYYNPSTETLHATNISGSITTTNITNDTTSTAPQYLTYVAGLGTQNLKIANVSGLVYYPATNVLSTLGKLAIGTVGWGLSQPQSGLYVSEANTTDTFSFTAVHIGLDVASAVPCIGLCSQVVGAKPYFKFSRSGTLMDGKIEYDLANNQMNFFVNQSANTCLELKSTSIDVKSGVLNLISSGNSFLNFNESTTQRWSIGYDITTNNLFFKDIQNSRDAIQCFENNTITMPVDSIVFGASTATSGIIKMNNIYGGYGNASNNFHIDNHTASGSLLINFTNQQSVRLFNGASTCNFAVYSNNADSIYTENSNGGAGLTQWNSRIRLHNTTSAKSVFVGDFIYNGVYSMGIYAYKTSMTAQDILHLNGIQTHASLWAMSGGDVLCPTMRIGCDVSSGVAYQVNNTLLQLGRSASFAYGMRFGGYAGAAAGLEASFQLTWNLHIDCPTTFYAGNVNYMYLNTYANRAVFIQSTSYTSDERIKKDIIELKDDNQFIEVFDKVKAVGAYRYKYRDTFRRSSTSNQYGFIAQKVQANYNEDIVISQHGSIPNIMLDCDFSYTIDDDLTYTFTINYDLDLEQEYLFYVWQNQEQIDLKLNQHIENVKPLTKNTFQYKPTYEANEPKTDKKYFKLELIGSYIDDKLSINKDKLFQLGWSATLGLIKKVEVLEAENIKLKNDIEIIKQHLNLT
jgi:hypothetical protein